MNSRLFPPDRRSFWRKTSAVGCAILLLASVSSCQPGGGFLGLGQETLFEDSFEPGASGEWDLEGDAEGSASIDNGSLTISVAGANVLQYATLEQPLFDDFALDLDATILSGSASDTYGVLFRLVPATSLEGKDAFYRFELTANGDYILERHHPDGTWTRLTDGWQSSTAIESGVGAANHMQIVASGSSVSIYVNGTPLGQYTDSDPLLQGRLAVDAASYGPSSFLVAFDNLIIRTP